MLWKTIPKMTNSICAHACFTAISSFSYALLDSVSRRLVNQIVPYHLYSLNFIQSPASDDRAQVGTWLMLIVRQTNLS